MEQSLLASLGRGVVGPLYASLLESGYGAGYVAMSGGEMIGFSFGRFSHGSMVASILRSWRRMLLPLSALTLRDPKTLARAMVRLAEPGHPPGGAGVGELVSIVVADAARGSDAGTPLGELLFERLRREGCNKVRWETLGTNARAQRYYEKIGGRIIGRAEVGGAEVLWYEKDLEGDLAGARPACS
jgi:ribosomal protein S18 acetylase RimI-like enzyme